MRSDLATDFIRRSNSLGSRSAGLGSQEGGSRSGFARARVPVPVFPSTRALATTLRAARTRADVAAQRAPAPRTSSIGASSFSASSFSANSIHASAARSSAPVTPSPTLGTSIEAAPVALHVDRCVAADSRAQLSSASVSSRDALQRARRSLAAFGGAVLSLLPSWSELRADWRGTRSNASPSPALSIAAGEVSTELLSFAVMFGAIVALFFV